MVLAGIFLPQVVLPPPASLFQGDPEQVRKERPMPASSQTRWYQSDIELAIRTADAGDLSAAARVSKSMRRDGTFSGLMSTRAGGLTRLPKQFRGTKEVVDECTRPDEMGLFDRIFGAKELELFCADGIMLGVAIGELVPVPYSDEPVFVRLDPEYLRYVWSEDRWYYLTVGGRVEVVPGDGRWILHLPGGYQSPWNQGLWPSLGRAYVAKEHAYLYRENYSGKLANPARVAVSPTGAGEKEHEAWFRRVMAWGVNTVFGLRPGYDVRLLESNGRGYDVFQDTIDSSDKEFAIGLAGQIVTVSGGTGFANADIHATIRSDLIQGDGDALAATLNRQGLRPIVNRLFGAGARCFVKWDTTPPADLKATAEAIQAAAKAIGDANAALAPYGMKVDAREIATRFKIPLAVAEKAVEVADRPGLAKVAPPTSIAPPKVIVASEDRRAA